jgi:hypothetical protein
MQHVRFFFLSAQAVVFCPHYFNVKTVDKSIKRLVEKHNFESLKKNFERHHRESLMKPCLK